MGNCIICGTSTDGPICDTHQEDVVFEFRGDRPDQLTPGRFYRGTVDGFADFGVFVDLSDRVTGLLHRSKLDRRLESLDWDQGDPVYVQVTNIRDNGDVDLAWSIRQSDREFRGTLIDAPDGDRLPDETADVEGATAGDADGSNAGAGSRPTTGPSSDAGSTAAAGDGESDGTPDSDSPPAQAREPSRGTGESTAEAGASGEAGGGAGAAESGSDADGAAGNDAAAETEPERVAVADLRERVGDVVRLEGEIVSVRQTSGPTVFELRDETGVVDCAAFEEAGVRAYPEVESGHVVRLDGEVRVRRDELQVETEALSVLDGEEREAVEGRMEAALEAEAEPGSTDPLADDPVLEGLRESVGAAATAVHRAVLESRPVVVRHPATADGYLAGAAIERAVLPLVREEHAQTDAAYHYFDRRPLEGDVYDMDDATADVTRMLGDRDRHDEKLPLVVFAGAGRTADSRDGLDLLGIYGVERLVADGEPVDPEVAEVAETVVAPADRVDRTATVVAATVAAAVNDAVRDDMAPLPAVSYWEGVPEQYAELAEEAGVDADAARELRAAVALEAYYHSYEDKRELIIDLLFDRQEGLAAQVASQFDAKMAAELETAEANLERRQVGGVDVAVLDTDAYTHRFDFPPTHLLLDELHRRHRDESEGRPFATVGLADDELLLRTTAEVDVRALAEAVRERVPEAGVSARGSRSGAIEFLVGERDAVLEAVLEALADRLSPEAEA